MAANVDAMLRAAIEAYKNGNKADARALLDKVLEVDEYNENAWMWMSAAVETAEEKRTCLENVLVINPNNEKARMGMKSLGFDPEIGSAPAATSSVFTDTSFAGGAAQGASVWDDDEPPTATSSASSAGRPSNANAGDLDSWISGMGIGSTPKQPSLAPTPHPFTDLIRGDDEEEEEEEFDPFADRMNNMFSADEFDIDEPPARPAAAARPSSPSPSSSRAIPPASFSSPSLFDEDEDDSSPFDEDMSGLTDEDFDEFAALIEDEDAFAPPARQSPMSPSGRSAAASRPGTGRLTSPMIEDEEEGEGPDPAKLFAMIPKEVEAAARLPGEDEESPRALLIGIVVLVILNLAALGYILVG
jgi:hypothetical protein